MKILCAYTKFSNTPESDMQSRVPHIVEAIKDGVVVKTTVMAEDPMDAMDKAYRVPANYWS